MRYIDRIKTLPNTDANNALILGTVMHEGIENGVEAAIKAYYDSFPIIDDLHVNEVIKLEYLIPRVQEILPKGQHEIKVVDSDFIGFVDLTSKNEEGSYDIYDFKYSNNVKNYLDSNQLHLYKYFYEKQYNKKIRNLYFVFIPKVAIKQKKTEDLYTFRKRIQEELEKSEIKLVQIEFDSGKVIEFYQGVKRILETKDFPKEPNYLCNWCEYQKFCEEGEDYMLLPKNERRNIEKIDKRVIWIYGAPFTGKTTFANDFPDLLMLNTDGNIKFVDAPYIAIKDIVTVEGRMSKRKRAWELLKEAIDELEKNENDFKSITLDLVEDAHEYCRLYMYDKLNISHESDDSFSAWDKVRTEFLSTMKRLINLDYENIILISHEDSSRDITRKSGDKITSIKPNLQEKVARKVAGMVDLVARVVADNGVFTLSFKNNEVIFGGGRLKTEVKEIPLDYRKFMEIYDEANKNAVNANRKNEKNAKDAKPSKKDKASEKRSSEVQGETKEDSLSPKVQDHEPGVKPEDEPPFDVKSEEPKPEINISSPKVQETEPEKPKRRTRKKRN